MGRMKEQLLEPAGVEAWREIETAALLGLPDFGAAGDTSLEALSAMPIGTAISAELSVSADGMVTALLKQLGRYSNGTLPQPLLALMVPSIAPGTRSLFGAPTGDPSANLAVVPDWKRHQVAATAPPAFARDQASSLRMPVPAADWPWDIKRALATLAAAGGGQLRLTATVLQRHSRLTRMISDLRDELVAASYAHPDDRSILSAQVNCRLMLEDPALIGFGVSISSSVNAEVLRNLIAIALFGTLAGASESDDVEHDLRLVAGSRHVPGRLLPSRGEVAMLRASTSLQPAAGATQWCIGHSASGIAVTLSDRDRERHIYVVGGTGTGKTTLLRSTIQQDMLAGETVVVLDCHGDLAEAVLAEVPGARVGDVINADAAVEGGGFAIDLLPDSADGASFEVAADMLASIFKGALYGDVPEGFGPIWESYFRNGLAVLMAASKAERCLANFPRVFSDAKFRAELLDATATPSVRDFWASAIRADGEISLTNVTPYITSKFTRYIGSSLARGIFPPAGCIDFEEALEKNKILILRCPKGVLGEGLAQLAMSASLMKIRAAVMARMDHRTRRPVRIYVDEFQNCRGDSLQTLLAEGRKFGASLVLANQSLGQIGGTDNNSMGAAALANVGNLIAFRLGAPDAIRLAPWLEASDQWQDLCRLPDFTMNARLLDRGKPVYFQGLRGLSGKSAIDVH